MSNFCSSWLIFFVYCSHQHQHKVKIQLEHHHLHQVRTTNLPVVQDLVNNHQKLSSTNWHHQRTDTLCYTGEIMQEITGMNCKPFISGFGFLFSLWVHFHHIHLKESPTVLVNFFYNILMWIFKNRSKNNNFWGLLKVLIEFFYRWSRELPCFYESILRRRKVRKERFFCVEEKKLYREQVLFLVIQRQKTGDFLPTRKK